jgi:hypothetical protein
MPGTVNVTEIFSLTFGKAFIMLRHDFNSKWAKVHKLTIFTFQYINSAGIFWNFQK